MEKIEPQNSTEKNDFFASYLSSTKKTFSFLTLRAMFEEEFFLFLTLFSGETIDVPSMDDLKQMQKEASIYVDLEDMTLEEVSEKYDVSERDAKYLKTKVSDRLSEFDVRESEPPTEEFEESFEEFEENS